MLSHLCLLVLVSVCFVGLGFVEKDKSFLTIDKGFFGLLVCEYKFYHFECHLFCLLVRNLMQIYVLFVWLYEFELNDLNWIFFLFTDDLLERFVYHPITRLLSKFCGNCDVRGGNLWVIVIIMVTYATSSTLSFINITNLQPKTHVSWWPNYQFAFCKNSQSRKWADLKNYSKIITDSQGTTTCKI